MTTATRTRSPGDRHSHRRQQYPTGVATEANYGQYLLDIADRSMLGGAGGAINITMPRAPLGWNDNTGSSGPGARINPLSWDDYPLVGSNSQPGLPGHRREQPDGVS